MESLSQISEYLRNLEDMFKDSGDSLEKLESMLEKAKTDLENGDIVGENDVCLPKEPKKRVVVFTRAPSKKYDAPHMRYSTPCAVEGIKAWDAELNMEYGDNYITEDVLDKLGFVRLDYEDYGRKKVKDVKVNIHGHIFKVDFVVLDYCNSDEPEVVFGRDFLVTTKCTVDFALSELKINITNLEEEKEVDEMIAELCEGMEKKKEGKEEVCKMGKANRKKGTLNKLTQPSNPKVTNSTSSSSSLPSTPPNSPKVTQPLTNEQKEAILENLEEKIHELMEKKPVIEVLNDYMTYRKKLDSVMMARSRLEDTTFDEVERERIVENGLPKKMSDPGNFVLPIKVNGTTPMYALADTGSSVSVMPYPLYQRLGLCNPQPNQSNLTMADNSKAKAMGEVKNVRVQIGYQAFLCDFLVLNIPVDKELPILLGRPFLRTCGAIIDMGHGTMTINDGILKHTYYPKPRRGKRDSMDEEEEDYFGCFEVGRDEEGRPKYGPLTPSFFDIEDEMERALAMEAFFNPFKNIFVFNKLTDFLGSLPVQLKNLEWGPDGPSNYKKEEGDGEWHVKFDIVCPSGRNFARRFKTQKTNRKISGKYQSEDILRNEYFQG